jgi:hypothetical protein
MMSLFENLFGKSWAATVEPTTQSNYTNQMQNAMMARNQSALNQSHIDWRQQAAAAQNYYYGSQQADAARYAYSHMHQTVNLNRSLIDTLQNAVERKMIGHLYVTCDEEVTWALLQDYEQSLTQPDLYIKWEK